MRRLGRAFKAFWRALRTKKQAAGQLREFVYLDETSVESLLASLDGEIVTGITSSRTRGSEVGIAATGEAVGVPTGVSPSAKWNRSVTVQEQRKSVAQSTFARFRSRHVDSLRLRGLDDEPPRRSIASAPERGRDVPLDELHRGDLIEVDARIGGSEVFEVRSVIDAVIGVVESAPELMPESVAQGIRGGAPISALIERLSEGLIPVEGEIVGYRAVEHGGVTWVVRQEVADTLAASGISSRRLVIAGVSLSALYWQDVRRVLFSNQKFRVLGRLLHDGGNERWRSVKITELLARINPELARIIDSMGPNWLRMLKASTGQPDPEPEVDATFQDQLMAFAHSYAEATGAPTPLELESVVRTALAHLDEPRSLSLWKAAQQTVERSMSDALGHSLTAQASLELRARFPMPDSPDAFDDVPQDGFDTKSVYLEVEIVAVYW